MRSDNTENSKRYSVFSTAGNLFGLEISNVREVIKPSQLTELPNVPSHVLGVYNLRGKIISLVDLKQILEIESNEGNSPKIAILVENNYHVFGFMIDEVWDFVEVNPSDVKVAGKDTPQGIKPFISGVFEDKNLGRLYMLDADLLMDENKIFNQGSH